MIRKKEIKKFLREMLSAPIVREIQELADFTEGNPPEPETVMSFVVENGTLAIDLRSGWLYFPGEEILVEEDIAVFVKETAVERVIVQGQMRPDMCNSHMFYYQVERSYRLAPFFFEEKLEEWCRYLDFDEHKQRYRLDFCDIKNRAQKELSAMISQDVGPFGDFCKCAGTPSLYEWCDDEKRQIKKSNILEQ